MYLKIKNGIVDKYPYSIADLKKENPEVSFSTNITDEVLSEFGVFKVAEVEFPKVDYKQNVFELTPQLINNKWTQVWEIKTASYDEILERVLELRANEYPPMSDYLDGIVKGDQAQIDKYIADCLAVKQKYPKP